MGDLNLSLREPQDAREEKLTMAPVDSRMGNVTAHFIPRRRYIGIGSWTWQII